MMFIDYMANPTSSIRNSMAIGYTSAAAKEVLRANADVVEYIKDNEYDVDEYFDNEGRYPVIDDTLGVMRDFGDRNDVVVNMWQRAKSGAHVDSNLWFVILAIVLAVGVCVALYFSVEALKLRPRKIK